MTSSLSVVGTAGSPPPPPPPPPPPSDAPAPQKAAAGTIQKPASHKAAKASARAAKAAAELAKAAGKLVINGAKLPRLVLHIQDSGGQDVFLSMLDLLHAPKASVSMLVFNLIHLAKPDRRDRCITQLRLQLDSFAVHASTAPLLLVGTRRAEALTLGVTLESLSEVLESELKHSPAFKHVVRNAPLCFFPIENSEGFGGDETIRKLVVAIEGAAMKLDSMKQRVPAGWLAVYDQLSAMHAAGGGKEGGKEGGARQWLTLSELMHVAKGCGLPHDPRRIPLEREVQLMLAYFHSLGAVCWYDLPGLRELIVLDPQWVVDAISMSSATSSSSPTACRATRRLRVSARTSGRS